MFTITKCDSEVLVSLIGMFDGLGEPPQVLAHDSPRPLVVHHVMGQMTLIEEGTGQALLAGQLVDLSPGDLLILAPGCEHSFAAGDNTLRLRHWHWPPELLHQDRFVVQPQIEFGQNAPSPHGDKR